MERDLNTRQMQAYVGLCLFRFCIAQSVQDERLEALIDHLLSILVAEDLAHWEQKGTQLPLPGRGDPVPPSIVEQVPSEHAGRFVDLLNSSVEVGIVDMYAKPTDEPAWFTSRCVELLKEADVELPSESPLDRYRAGSGPWGEPISDSDFKEFLNAYSRNG